MGRPPLPLGSYGKITTWANGTGFTARTQFRDMDGVVRPVKRNGKSKNAAERALKAALIERQAPVVGATIAPDTRFSKVADLWFDEIRSFVEAGERAPGTLDTYTYVYRAHVKEQLGSLRVNEVTTPAVDAVIAEVKKTSASSARTSKVVISGILRLATRHGAITGNPAREVDRIKQKPKKRPRSLTAEERDRWFAALEASKPARAWDLADLTKFLLATGGRIGECLATGWTEIDFDACTVRLDWHLVRVVGKGLLRLPSTKTGDDDQRTTLPLPGWAMDMLRRRRALIADDVEPVFPDSLGGWRDPTNVRRVWRQVREEEGMDFMVSHMMRKTVATFLDDAGVSTRKISDQLGHRRVSMMQDRYLGRGLMDRETADTLEGMFSDDEPGKPSQ